MYQEIHEKIQVTAKFIPGEKPSIVSFTWKDKIHEVNELTLLVKARKGKEAVWLFHVVTKNGAYKLRFNAGELTWYLEELTWEE